MKRALDFIICVICIVIFVLAYFYVDHAQYRFWLLLCSALGAVFFFVSGLSANRRQQAGEVTVGPALGNNINEIILLSEENTELYRWDLYGKTGLVIGRDVGENKVDIDLSLSVYASMVEVEHAVLNYVGDGWMVEDLGTKNGLSLKSTADGRLYKLAPGQPCKVNRGDIIQVGLTKLLLR